VAASLETVLVSVLLAVPAAHESPALAAQEWMALAAQASAAPAAGPTVSVSHHARALQPGELVILTVRTSRPATEVRATGFGRDLKVVQRDPLTWRALLGIDLDVAPGSYQIPVEAVVDGARVRQVASLHVLAKAFPTRRLTVAERYVEPPLEVQARIAEEAAQLGSIWTSSVQAPWWDEAFVAPVPQRANSVFGSRSIFNGQSRSPHSGADFPSPAGTPVVAPNGGRVVLARDLYFTGQTVVIDHGLGLISLFAHLSRIDVPEGAAVDRGATLGQVGATGRVTGAHLHWTVRADGARVDPVSLLALGAQILN
jgi:murein DD-endopeptidase MepM/ murein hydrolase activator NlpD